MWWKGLCLIFTLAPSVEAYDSSNWDMITLYDSINDFKKINIKRKKNLVTGFELSIFQAV